MNFKKIANAKNIACLIAVLALGVGIIIAEKSNSGAPDISKKTDKNTNSSDGAGDGEKEDRETIILAAAIPELSCGSVDFDGNVVFADPKGSYSFMENGSSTSGITVKDDSGADIFFSMEGGTLTMTRDNQPATGFVYKRHIIELKSGKLYYDSSPVEYNSDSFSAYRLNDDYVVECTARGQYRLKDKDGNYTNECELTESTGAKIRITADESGFYTEGVNDDYFYNVYKLKDDLLMTSWSYVLYVNGKELVPYGFTDVYVNPDIEIDMDSINLEPTRPPMGYGSVSTENDGISELTSEMLGYVNEVRAQYGMLPVYGLEKLDGAADTRAQELAESFGHTRPDEKESSYSTVLSKSGLIWWRCGENIAKGGTDCREVFESWLCSQEHRAVMLDPNMKYMSLAKYEEGGSAYWEQLFFNDTYIPTDETEE